MDFDWSSEHRSFRARVRSFIREALPADWERKSGLDLGAPYTVAFAREFCAALAGEGLLVPHWPRAYGGQDLDAWHHWILNEEMFRAGEPRSYQYMSVNWAGPAIIKCGTEEQKRRYLPCIAQGGMFVCQGFSEPGAGSDLGALRTRATPDGTDRFRLSGQKVWTSAASFADICILLARTDSGPSRSSITMFIVPMDTPGITTRMIPGLQGSRSFHEIFLDDVAVDRADIVGAEGGGWAVMRAILHDERIGIPRYTMAERAIEQGLDWLLECGRMDDLAGAAAALAQAKCDVARLQCYRIIDDRVKNVPPSSATALARNAMIEADREVAAFIGRFLMDRVISGDDPLLTACYKRTAATGIAGGTKEMQLKAIAQEFLELPRG